MIYGSVCSGIEAATMAWHSLGWTPSFFSEIEAFPSAVLAHHYGSNMPGEPLATNGIPNYGDFTKIGAEAGPIDLLVGGTPCQSFSVAGKRLGLDDPRGNLALEYLSLARRLRARWIVWENVPGVLSSHSGDEQGEEDEGNDGLESADFATFLSFVQECGYGFAYRVLDAQYIRVDGYARAVPQRRRRVFLVGYLGDWRRAAAVLFEPESMRGDSPPRREAGQRAAPTISSRPTGGGGLGTDFDLDGGLIANAFAPAITRNPYGDNESREGMLVAFGITADAIDRSGEGSQGSAGERSGLGIEQGLSPTLRAKRPNAVAFGGGNTSGSIDVSTALTAHGQRQDFEVETFIAEVASTLPAGGNTTGGERQSGMGAETAGTMLVAHAPRGEGFDASEDGTGRGTPIVPIFAPPTAATLTRGAESAGKGVYAGRRQEDESNLVATPAIAFMPTESFSSGDNFEVSPTLRVGSGLKERGEGPAIAKGWAVRRLMPIECERLQGFPDGFTNVPYRGKQAADGPRYKALGNSMAVNSMRWIGQRIDIMEKLIQAGELAA